MNSKLSYLGSGSLGGHGITVYHDMPDFNIWIMIDGNEKTIKPCGFSLVGYSRLDVLDLAFACACDYLCL